jgi:amyloid beta precursor protein binding protein 1
MNSKLRLIFIPHFFCICTFSCRYGASELHSVAAFMGGAAAQEVIKMIVCQFIPVNNTFIYNAMKQSSLSVEL